MNTPHLLPALTASILFAVFLLFGENYAGWMENQYVHALSVSDSAQRRTGTAFQKAAFRQPDLLALYGSSELDLPDPFRANRVFWLYPTGFTTFPVGGNGCEPLIILQRLAGIGRELAGKKVAISLSPDFFLETMMPPTAYAGNFSALHAYSLIFSTDLSMGLKGAVARRMLDYPATYTEDPLLRFGLTELSNGSPWSAALYYASLPLGEVRTGVLGLQDHWDALNYIWDQGPLSTVVLKHKRNLNWEVLLEHAQARYMPLADSNQFGFSNIEWQRLAPHWLEHKNILDDKEYRRVLHSSKAWADLDLLLREMQELGAQPMLLSIPFPGRYYDYMGVSRSARQDYYDRLEALAAFYQVSIVDFQSHDEDKYFFLNPGSHLSSIGWIYYSDALDAFFHGREGALN